jgi:hypothetical protein
MSLPPAHRSLIGQSYSKYVIACATISAEDYKVPTGGGVLSFSRSCPDVSASAVPTKLKVN